MDAGMLAGDDPDDVSCTPASAAPPTSAGDGPVTGRQHRPWTRGRGLVLLGHHPTTAHKGGPGDCDIAVCCYPNRVDGSFRMPMVR